MKTLRVLRYGVVPYGQALALQHTLRERLQVDSAHPGFLVCLQHPPVVTLGKRGQPSDIISPTLLADRGVELFRVDRGGEATYHGPGQLVIYPIVRLDDLGLGVVDVVRALAHALAEAVRPFGVELHYDPDHPGLWTDETPGRKMGSVGMRVSRGVSTHGAALNVLNDMIPFSWIVACGMPNAPMTRLCDYLEEPPDLEALGTAALERFAARIGVALAPGDEELPPAHAWVQSLPMSHSEGGAMGR